jgi:putative NIF3 family GTP cyclohydrolase 1 type 2
MKAMRLYSELEKDFITPSLRDDWAQYMHSIDEFLTENFKQRSIGLVCDNTKEIQKVYTSVFPSASVMQAILNNSESEIMLFVHHPSIWDIRKAPEAFSQMDLRLLKAFRERKISIYNLHVPLDNYSEYSTSNSLAKLIGLESIRPFFDYFGAKAAVIGRSKAQTVKELALIFESAMGHRISLYKYGTEDISNGLAAVAAGGGNMVNLLEEILNKGVNTLITGITVRNDQSERAHEYASKNGINILGGTHYSTEKPACQAICGYFSRLGLPSCFVHDTPVLEDL